MFPLFGLAVLTLSTVFSTDKSSSFRTRVIISGFLWHPLWRLSMAKDSSLAFDPLELFAKLRLSQWAHLWSQLAHGTFPISPIGSIMGFHTKHEWQWRLGQPRVWNRWELRSSLIKDSSSGFSQHA